jgi:hypothetical protein
LEVIRAIQARQAANPKTVLGYYAGVSGILLSGCVAAVWVLATTHTATYLIPWILGFGGLVFVAVLVGVYRLNVTDPSKLMLRAVTGSEYYEIQRARLGDSLHGEREVVLLGGAEPIPPPGKPLPVELLPPAEEVPGGGEDVLE